MGKTQVSQNVSVANCIKNKDAVICMLLVACQLPEKQKLIIYLVNVAIIFGYHTDSYIVKAEFYTAVSCQLIIITVAVFGGK